MQNNNRYAVILDMDGLMIDTEPLYKYALQKTAQEFGYTLTDNFMMRLVGRPDSDCRRMIAAHLGPDFPLQSFWKQWPLLWRSEALSNGIKQKPGLPELLSFLTKRRIPAAIATSSSRRQAFFSLDAANINHPFDHFVTVDEVEKGKPAPDIFLKAAKRLETHPKFCIALEDSENGIRAASSAGMHTIMVPDMIQPSEDIRNKTNFLASSLHEAKDHICDIITGKIPLDKPSGGI